MAIISKIKFVVTSTGGAMCGLGPINFYNGIDSKIPAVVTSEGRHPGQV